MTNSSAAHISSTLSPARSPTRTSSAFMIPRLSYGRAIAPTTHRSESRTSRDQANILTSLSVPNFGISGQNELSEARTATAPPTLNTRRDFRAAVASSSNRRATERDYSSAMLTEGETNRSTGFAAGHVERDRNSAPSKRCTTGRSRMTRQVNPSTFRQAYRLEKCRIARKQATITISALLTIILTPIAQHSAKQKKPRIVPKYSRIALVRALRRTESTPWRRVLTFGRDTDLIVSINYTNLFELTSFFLTSNVNVLLLIMAVLMVEL